MTIPTHQLLNHLYCDETFARVRRPRSRTGREILGALLTGLVLPMLALASLAIVVVGLIFFVRAVAFALRALSGGL